MNTPKQNSKNIPEQSDMNTPKQNSKNIPGQSDRSIPGQVSEQNKKKEILAAALDMFSVNGYTAVPVRDIGKAVGIKESSIYFHFRNKEDILTTLLGQAEQFAYILKESFNRALSTAPGIKADKFIDAGIAYIEGYLLEDRIYKIISMLTIEKQRNMDAAAIYHKLLFTVPLEHHAKVFAFMAEKGYVRQGSPAILAAEYQAIILYVFQKYFSNPGAVGDNSRTMARSELAALLKHFFMEHINEEVSSS